ncbi:hypothetical protein C8J34_10223 [Rhizobium sp. PP-F2F-G36]|nr:hypothetical protein C8J34_10223 [Rhizobium sp. PP-F2F-G36]
MALHHLVATIPEWFHPTDVGTTELLGGADIELDNAVGRIRADVRVRDRNGTILVQEQIPGTKYPKTCHERHIQSDEHFCIGLDAGNEISSSDHAVVWWGLLKHFLELQRVAERTRRWPPQQEMAHGDAGPHQRAAMEAATELGIADQYMRMLEGEKIWFADCSLKVNSKGRLANGWMSCPVGCRKNGRPVSRSSCSRQDLVIRLIAEEKQRREKLALFNAIVRVLGEPCCGTMLHCPLAGVDASTTRTSTSNP